MLKIRRSKYTYYVHILLILFSAFSLTDTVGLLVYLYTLMLIALLISFSWIASNPFVLIRTGGDLVITKHLFRKLVRPIDCIKEVQLSTTKDLKLMIVFDKYASVSLGLWDINQRGAKRLVEEFRRS